MSGEVTFGEVCDVFGEDTSVGVRGIDHVTDAGVVGVLGRGIGAI